MAIIMDNSTLMVNVHIRRYVYVFHYQSLPSDQYRWLHLLSAQRHRSITDVTLQANLSYRNKKDHCESISMIDVSFYWQIVSAHLEMKTYFSTLLSSMTHIRATALHYKPTDTRCKRKLFEQHQAPQRLLVLGTNMVVLITATRMKYPFENLTSSICIWSITFAL